MPNKFNIKKEVQSGGDHTRGIENVLSGKRSSVGKRLSSKRKARYTSTCTVTAFLKEIFFLMDREYDRQYDKRIKLVGEGS